VIDGTLSSVSPRTTLVAHVRDPLTTRRGLACAVVLAGVTALAAGGCGGGSAATGTSSASSFRHAFAAADKQLRPIVVALDAAAVTVNARRTNGLAERLNGLAAQAQQQASALEQLGPPPRYNTALRDIGAALNGAAADLTIYAADAGGRDPGAARVAAARMRSDAAAISSTGNRLAMALGLPAG
jgi:hypothetical protein